jgi:hypothetical protein
LPPLPPPSPQLPLFLQFPSPLLPFAIVACVSGGQGPWWQEELEAWIGPIHITIFDDYRFNRKLIFCIRVSDVWSNKIRMDQKKIQKTNLKKVMCICAFAACTRAKKITLLFGSLQDSSTISLPSVPTLKYHLLR